MKLTAQIKLLPTALQADLLLRTMETANAACNAISSYAWRHRAFRQYDLHHALYHDLRQQFSLSAQMVVRCLGKVADAYKLDRDRKRTFRERGGIAYDSRLLTYRQAEVSIWALGGRQRMPYAIGEHHARLMQYQQGESDLVYRRGEFYLFATCEVPEEDEEAVDGVLGVDFGIVQIATDSDGESFAGAVIDRKRERYATHRAGLQSTGTRSAKRRLKKVSGRQRRFQRDVNHTISKRLVQKAKDTGRAIVLEDLSGIRERITVSKAQRSRHHNWAFYDLRAKITYKARLRSVPVVVVDPAYTSRTCYTCGHCDKTNRKSQAEFVCQACGHRDNADRNAALNIAARAEVNRPIVAQAALAA